MILVLPSCPLFSALSYTSYFFTSLKFCSKSLLLGFLDSCEFLYKCFPGKFCHRFPCIFVFFVNFYVSSGLESICLYCSPDFWTLYCSPDFWTLYCSPDFWTLYCSPDFWTLSSVWRVFVSSCLESICLNIKG
jgi:hypothetical protein